MRGHFTGAGERQVLAGRDEVACIAVVGWVVRGERARVEVDPPPGPPVPVVFPTPLVPMVPVVELSALPVVAKFAGPPPGPPVLTAPF